MIKIIALIIIIKLLGLTYIIDPTSAVLKNIVLAPDYDSTLALFSGSNVSTTLFNNIVEFKELNDYTHLEMIYNYLTTSYLDVIIKFVTELFLIS